MSERILIVDDEENLVWTVSTLLKRKGYAVISAPDGEEGVAKALAEKPDLIVLDIKMPKMNGIQACQKLQENPQTKQIPIIMLTSKKTFEMQMGSLHLGAWDFIEKPFDPKELVDKVERGLEEAALRKEER